MSPKLAKTLKITLPLLLGVFLVWYSLRDVPLSQILDYWHSATKGWILLGVFLGLLSHLSRAYRWRFQLEPLGYTIKYGNSIMAVFATYIVNYTIPRAGEVARATILTNYEGVPFEKGFGTIVAERMADLIIILGIVMVTLFLQFDFIYGFLVDKFNATKIALAISTVLILIVLFYIVIKKSQSKMATKIKNFVNGLIDGAMSIFKMKKKWAFIAHTLFIWTMYVMMFYVTSFSLTETSNIPFAAILIGFISASFSIAATSGGIGAYPLAVYLGFSIFGIAKDPSIAFGYIIWASQTLLIILCGGLSLIYLPIYNRKKTNVER